MTLDSERKPASHDIIWLTDAYETVGNRWQTADAEAWEIKKNALENLLKQVNSSDFP